MFLCLSSYKNSCAKLYVLLISINSVKSSRPWYDITRCLPGISHIIKSNSAITCSYKLISCFEFTPHYVYGFNQHHIRLMWCWFNTLRPRQNCRHFADDIFKCIFVNENVWILLKISLKCVPKVWINNNLALIQIMAWRRPWGKPLSEPMMVSLLTHTCVTRPQRVNCHYWENYSKSFTHQIVLKKYW